MILQGCPQVCVSTKAYFFIFASRKSPFPMRLLVFILFSAFLPAAVSAQQTLIKGAISDTFNLACPGCSTEVARIGLFKGTPTMPYNLQKIESPNLLHWKHYNSILGQEMITDRALSWEKCTQLLDEVKENELLSLHLNLIWQDSLGNRHKINLMASGFRKEHLSKLPFFADFTPDAGAPERFVAVAQLRAGADQTETYEIIEGFMEIQSFDLKTAAIKGTFEFGANCYGLIKTGFFNNGHFE
jgi:hypothetical protein